MNWVGRLAAGRPVATLMLITALLLLGAVAAVQTPVTLMPSAAEPAITIETEYYGVGPDKVEQLITQPIEESVSTVGGIVELFSVSEEGKSRISILFKQNTDVRTRTLEVRERVDLVAAGFPREVQKPVLLRYDPEQRPVIIVALNSARYSLPDLREIAERRIKKDLERIEGVSEIIVAGGREKEILVECDRDKLAAFGVSLNQVMGAIQAHNVNLSLGQVSESGGRYAVLVKGRYRSIDDIRRTPVVGEPGRGNLRVGDIARVYYGYREQDSAARVNGEERVSLYLQRTTDANVLDLSRNVRNRIATATGAEIEYEIVLDQANPLRHALRNLTIAYSIGILLCTVWWLRLFLQMRYTLLLAALPAGAFLIASFGLFVGGYGYDLVNLSGFTLGAGLAIFTSCCALLAAGHPTQAAHARSISSDLFLGLALIGIVFLPLLFLDAELRTVFGGLAIFTVAPSLIGFVATLALAPILDRRAATGSILTAAPWRRTFVTLLEDFRRWMRRSTVGRLIFLVPARLLKAARSSERWIVLLANRRPALAKLLYLAVVLLALVAYSCSRYEPGARAGEAQVNATIELPSGSSFESTNQAARQVEQLLGSVSGVKRVSSRVDAGQALLTIEMDGWAGVTEETLDRLRKSVGSREPAFVYFSTDESGQSAGELTVDVLGEDLIELDNLTRSLASRAQNWPGVSQVVLRYKPPRPELQILIDKAKAHSAGATAEYIGSEIRLALQGGVASKFFEPTREVDIKLRLMESFRNSREQLTLQSLSVEGGALPLPEASRIVEKTTPVKVFRKNKKRVYSFSVRVAAGKLEDVAERIEDLQAAALPPGYRIEPGRDSAAVLGARQRMLTAFGLSLLLIYMLLAAYRESLVEPIFLMIPLPAPVAAACLALDLAGSPLSIPAFFGLAILCVLVIVQATLIFRDVDGEPGRLGAHRGQPPGSAFFLLASVSLALFCLPLCLLFGAGGSLVRSVGITLLAGGLASAFVTPGLALAGRQWLQSLGAQLKREPGPGTMLASIVHRRRHASWWLGRGAATDARAILSTLTLSGAEAHEGVRRWLARRPDLQETLHSAYRRLKRRVVALRRLRQRRRKVPETIAFPVDQES